MFLNRWYRLNAKNAPRVGSSIVLVCATNGHKRVMVMTDEMLSGLRLGKGIWWEAEPRKLLVRATHYSYLAADPRPEPEDTETEMRPVMTAPSRSKISAATAAPVEEIRK